MLFVLCFVAVCADAATITYTYDNLNRLIKVIYDKGFTEYLTYDAAGNITHVAVVAPIAMRDINKDGSVNLKHA